MAAVSGLIRVMEKAARKAGGKLRRDFGEVEHLQVSRKGPSDFVSKADQISERTIYDELLHARPDWGFELEEGGTIEGKPGNPRRGPTVRAGARSSRRSSISRSPTRRFGRRRPAEPGCRTSVCACPAARACRMR
jgi:3'-phosphoadenosine 5'-phosphosulfate (PAPS) 3'-phosphatase